MNPFSTSQDERLRLIELSRYSVVLGEEEDAFTDIARIATLFTGRQYGGVSLVDDHWVWLKGRVGLDAPCVPRKDAFCAYAVEGSDDMFVVPNTLQDLRFRDNPLVTSSPNIRFYAAANLVGHRGYNLGTVWIMGTEPGELTDEQANALRALASQTVRLLEMRYKHPITHLPNRSGFVTRLQHLLNREIERRTSVDATAIGNATAAPCVIGCIKLHNLHLVNTAYSAEIGEELLRTLTAHLLDWVGEHNMLAHLENNDFAFALFDDERAGNDRLDRLIDLLSQPFAAKGALLHVATSVGISRFPASGSSASSLLDQASAATSRVGEIHPATVLTYFDNRHHQVAEDIAFIRQIPDFLRERRFVPYYQPQIDIRSRRVIGFEALARLRSPEFGVVTPDRFIRPAETSGFIFEIDMLMLEQVCRDLRAWRDAGLAVAPVAVNLSRVTLAKPNLAKIASDILVAHGVPFDLIELEITESGLSDDPALFGARINEMHDLGFRIAIDDFGTGQSNLSALKDIRFELLKADRLYVHGASTNLHIGGILRFIKGISEVFDTDMLCEGVETQEDLQWISALGCRLFQGWYFSRALPPEAIPDLLRRLTAYYHAPEWAEDDPQRLAAVLQNTWSPGAAGPIDLAGDPRHP